MWSELAEPCVKDCTALDASAGLQKAPGLALVVAASSAVVTDVVVCVDSRGWPLSES